MNFERSTDAQGFLRDLSNNLSDIASQAELRSLAAERDPELLGSGLNAFAGRQESRGRGDLAQAVYQRVAASPETFGPAEARRAGQRLEALRGRGNFGARAEIFSRNFIREVSDPANLGGMAFAGGVFQSLRLASYARLLATPGANLLTRGLGARGLSLSLAFLAEAPAFSLGVRSINALLGRPQDWRWSALGHELAATYLTLGALRLSGGAGDLLFRRMGNANGLLPRGLVQQASMLTGITAAHWLEQRAGLRERTDGGTLLAGALASLIHFNVAGRLLHGLGGGEFNQRLRLHQERLENLPPPALGKVRSWALAGSASAMVEPEAVFMATNGAPSTPPPPMASGEIRGGARSSVPPSRDIRGDLTEIEKVLGTLYDKQLPGLAWQSDLLEVSRLYRQVLEYSRHSEENSAEPRDEIVNHLRDLSTEAKLVHRLLNAVGTAGSSANLSLLSGDTHLVRQFFEHFYRSANNFMNFLDNSGTIPEPLQQLRSARFWLQHGLERATLGEPIANEHALDFPYTRGENGIYLISGSGKHVIIVGDERGPRTFDLMNSGNQVTHVEFDNSRMRITQRLMEMKVQRAKDSGQWRLELPDGARFESRISNADPADYVEAYFPVLFDALKPRSDSQRMEQLRELIVTNLIIRLKTDGSAFVISSRHDAIEDLASAVQAFPHLELQELRVIHDRMPLRAGMHVTAVEGENLYSWLVFRKRGPE